jgi:hypothetical protein
MNLISLSYCNLILGNIPKAGLISLAVSLLLFSSSLPQSEKFPLKIAEGQEQASPTTQEFVAYTNGTKYGISIEYPNNWKVTEDNAGVWFISPVDETGNIRITSQPVNNTSLADLVQIQSLQTKDSNKEVDILSSNMTTIDGNPANRTDYKFKVEVPKFLGADIFDYEAIRVSTLKNDKLYTVTYFATPESFHIYLPIVQKMLSTLKIQEQPIVT